MRFRDEWAGPARRGAFELLRRKWGEVPFTAQGRVHSSQMLNLSTAELRERWGEALIEQSTGENFSIRGWYYALYSDQFRGKRVLDFGSGLGFDTITFARAGALVDSVDLVRDNLTVTERLAETFGLTNVKTVYLEDLTSLDTLREMYDVIWCCGSMLHSPFDVVRDESQILLRHLKPAGRWIELAYPRSRWEREGSLPFERWGEKTDGGAPWVEWKDLEKIRKQLAPASFRAVLAFDFHDRDFNWFDLQRTDSVEALPD